MAKRANGAPKQWERDDFKEKFWRDKITEWEVSGLSVSEFCRQHQISDSSFRAWRREICIRDREGTAFKGGVGVTPSLPASVKDSRGRVIPAKFKQMCAAPVADMKPEQRLAPLSFVPLTLVEDKNEKARVSPAVPVAIEVQSPNGFVFRLNCDADLQLLSGLIKSMEDSK
ncbi:MAG: transposase [Candidatus Obscuribacterales bacterium]|nr:transposase [Candidatus Obscuribacterales bacterium]